MDRAFGRLPELVETALWQSALEGEGKASVYFALWLSPLSAPVREAVIERLHVRKSTREEVEGVVNLVQRLHGLPPAPRPSAVEQAVRPYAEQPRILLAARAALGETETGDLLDRYQAEWRDVETALDGNDLRALGLPPGPRYADLLDRLLAARLDGEVEDEAGERALLQELLAESSEVQ
jgi:tRNA nucleotidyltransferase (CCA-adding enzyme)